MCRPVELELVWLLTAVLPDDGVAPPIRHRGGCVVEGAEIVPSIVHGEVAVRVLAGAKKINRSSSIGYDLLYGSNRSNSASEYLNFF